MVPNVFELSYNNLNVPQVSEVSDRRIKENFVATDLEASYNKIMQLQVTNYNFIGQDRTHTGLIAQEVDQIIPEAITKSEKFGFSDFHTVANREITNNLLAAVQHMDKKYNDLETKYNTLLEILSRNNLN